MATRSISGCHFALFRNGPLRKGSAKFRGVRRQEHARKHNRKELRAELERRVAAEGYQLADIFPELRAASSGPARQKRPLRYRDPQNPDHAWSGVGRTPKWVQAIVDERGIDVAAFKSIPMYRIHAAD